MFFMIQLTQAELDIITDALKYSVDDLEKMSHDKSISDRASSAMLTAASVYVDVLNNISSQSQDPSNVK